MQSAAPVLTDGAFSQYPATRGAQQRDQPRTTSAHVRRYSGFDDSAIRVHVQDANRHRRAGEPTDRHRFQIGYGSGSDRCHQLYFDPRRKETTLLFGVHVEMGLFIGVDPRMHNPTWFPRSVEFRTSDLEAARARGWHGWERERADARHKVRHEESLLTETVIAFRPDQFLRYVEFERLAGGLDCGERCLQSDRIEKSLSRGEALTMSGRHPLEIQLGLSASDILDMAMGRIGRA